jgi:predicted permease
MTKTIATAWVMRLRSAFRLVTGFVRRRAEDAALEEEMQFHIDQSTARNIRHGMAPDDAHRAALVAIGGRERWTEATRDEQRSRPLEDFGRDLQYGAAALRRNMGFTVGAVTTVALAIAATATVFNFVSAVYFRSLPVPEGARLVHIRESVPPTTESNLGFSVFTRLRARTTTFDLVAAHYSTAPLYVRARGEAGEVPGAVVSASYFPILGLRPALGRFFAPAEDSVPDRDAVAVIGHALWRARFVGDSGVIGEHITINGRAFTIIGVTPPGFEGIAGGITNSLWIPMAMLHTGYRYCDGFTFSCRITAVLARLAPGRTVSEAQDELTALRQTLLAGADTTHAARNITVRPAMGIRDQEQLQYASLSKLLWAIAIVLLFVACANLGGLLLARGMARRREFALRSSLGAGRWRIARQLLTESLLLGLAGGVVGVALSVVMSRAMQGFFTTGDRRIAMPLDGRMIAFVALVTLAAVLLFGFFPALRVSRVDVSEALKSGSNRTSNRARFALVGGQTVLAVALLSAAGLLSRSFERAMAGGAFDPAHIAQVRLRPQLVGYSVDSSIAYFRAAIAKIRNVPGVISVAPARGSLDVRSAGAGNVTVSLQGDAPPTSGASRVGYFDVGPGFFAMFRIPILAGREFSDHDTPSSPLATLVNETLAKQLWGSTDVLGRTVSFDAGSNTMAGNANWKTFQVIGVVKDYRQRSYGEAPLALAYVAFWQMPFGPLRDTRVAIRVADDPLRALPSIQDALTSVDPAVPVTSPGSIERDMRATYAEVRLGRMVLISCAALTLFLAGIGLYGVVSYLVTQRAKEIAIRLAIGARQQTVVAILLQQSLRPTAAGAVLGLIASVAGAPLLSRWLFGIDPVDIGTLCGAIATVTLVALIASYVPARRAANIDPATVFRSD